MTTHAWVTTRWLIFCNRQVERTQHGLHQWAGGGDVHEQQQEGHERGADRGPDGRLRHAGTDARQVSHSSCITKHAHSRIKIMMLTNDTVNGRTLTTSNKL